MMLALRKWRAETICPLCGLDRAVCRSFDTDGAVKIDAERCHVSTALVARQSADAKNETVLHPTGLAYTASVQRPS